MDEAARHGDVGDVHGSDLIGSQDRHVPEQIRVDFVSRFRFRAIRTQVDRCDAHPLRQRRHMQTPDRKAFLLQQDLCTKHRFDYNIFWYDLPEHRG